MLGNTWSSFKWLVNNVKDTKSLSHLKQKYILLLNLVKNIKKADYTDRFFVVFSVYFLKKCLY